jgi:hypothetical protein
MFKSSWREALSPKTWHMRAAHRCSHMHGFCPVGNADGEWVRWQSPESDPDGCSDCLIKLARIMLPLVQDKKEQMELLMNIGAMEEFQRLCRDAYERRN